MNVDACEINKMLYRHFANYDYRLNNSFVYAWESDFFAMSGSSYFVEVEVKVSRGDYFRDFEKDKHELFQAAFAKKTFLITRREGRGDLICKYRYGSLHNKPTWQSSRHPEWYSVWHNGKDGYWVNDNVNAYIRHSIQEVYAPATHIHFKEVAKQKCPNQIYFACPENLIKIEEIPAYAGLIYCTNEVKIIKKAPYLHKNKQDMTRELLQKFYNLWQYKTSLEKKLEIAGQIQLFNQPIK